MSDWIVIAILLGLSLISTMLFYAAGKLEGETGDMFTAPHNVQIKSKLFLFPAFTLSWGVVAAAFYHEEVLHYLTQWL